MEAKAVVGEHCEPVERMRSFTHWSRESRSSTPPPRIHHCARRISPPSFGVRVVALKARAVAKGSASVRGWLARRIQPAFKLALVGLRTAVTRARPSPPEARLRAPTAPRPLHTHSQPATMSHPVVEPAPVASADVSVTVSPVPVDSSSPPPLTRFAMVPPANQQPRALYAIIGPTFATYSNIRSLHMGYEVKARARGTAVG